MPLDDPRVIRTIRSVPKEPVEIANGVRWYIDNERGVDFSRPGPPQFGMGGVLELHDNENEATITYRVKIWLRGDREPVPEGLVTIIEPKPGDRRTIRCSRAINDLQSIERVEFTRQQFRFEQINGVETHLDLLPPDP